MTHPNCTRFVLRLIQRNFIHFCEQPRKRKEKKPIQLPLNSIWRLHGHDYHLEYLICIFCCNSIHRLGPETLGCTEYHLTCNGNHQIDMKSGNFISKHESSFISHSLLFDTQERRLERRILLFFAVRSPFNETSSSSCKNAGDNKRELLFISSGWCNVLRLSRLLFVCCLRGRFIIERSPYAEESVAEKVHKFSQME